VNVTAVLDRKTRRVSREATFVSLYEKVASRASISLLVFDLYKNLNALIHRKADGECRHKLHENEDTKCETTKEQVLKSSLPSLRPSTPRGYGCAWS
jgi:hypothetical protein